MEANVTISVNVDTLPRLIGHLISEEELKFEPLSRKVAKAAFNMEEGKIFESTQLLSEAMKSLSAIESRLRQCDMLIRGLGNALNGKPDETEDRAKNIVSQAQDISEFSSFLSKMGDQEENED
jgi:hypothetical protein